VVEAFGVQHLQGIEQRVDDRPQPASVGGSDIERRTSFKVGLRRYGITM
jgi:hypothetical protein